MTTAGETKLSLQRRVVLAMAVSALGCAAAAGAGAAPHDPVELQVIDRETGETARVWRHAGRLHVAGRPGARYGLRVTNNTPRRMLVVMSVDGVNILTGETASHNQRGYVFSPYETYDVSGWRKSDTEVAAFQFASLSRSYAARTGRPGDVGVIGIAAFAERSAQPLAVSPPPRARAAAPESADRLGEIAATGQRGPSAPAPVAAPPPGRAASNDIARSERLGTAHGQREWSRVTTVAFERASMRPQFTHQLEYDSYDNLVARGVIRTPPRPAPRPRPFPANPDRGYVPDPPYGR